MGHVVNCGYRLVATEEWVRFFGPITLPYPDEYHPSPFSRDLVRHLPGWYAQRHPDEDWSETFAVWMTPGRDWRSEYADWPVARAKLEYCDRAMRAVAARDPVVTASDRDEDVSEIGYTLNEYDSSLADLGEPLPPAIDDALRAIFEDYGVPEGGIPAELPRRRASERIRRMSADIATEVDRWTGHFPERTRPLLEHMAARADALARVDPEVQEGTVIVGLTALVSIPGDDPREPREVFPVSKGERTEVCGSDARRALSPGRMGRGRRYAPDRGLVRSRACA